MGEALEPVGELIDGVVRHRQRAVTAGIGDGELVIRVELLARVDGEDGRFALVQLHAAAIGIEDVFGLDEIAMILNQPVDAVGLAALLVRGKREDDVAVGAKAFTMQTEKRLHQDGIGLLHVLRAAAIVVAVLGQELKGVGRPVVTTCFDDIQVADEQNGLFATGPVIAHNKILLAIIGAEQLHVRCREAGGKESLLHGLRGIGNAAYGVGRVDVNELAEDIDRLFVVGVSSLRAGERRARVQMVKKK